MKHILLVFFVGLIPINSQAQRIASTFLLQDGTTVDSSHRFVDGEMPTFYLESGQGENIFWSFSFYDKSDEKNICIKSKTDVNPFTLKIEPSLFSSFDIVSDCQKIEYPNDSSVYIRCSVDLHQGNVIIDSVPLVLNVLPSHPKIKEASIVGNFDFEGGGYNPLAELTVLFSAERMNECRFVSYVSDSLNVFQFPENSTRISYNVDINEKSKNQYEFKYEYADWGEFYTVVSYNEYGGIHGDTIFTNSIIDDAEIIHYLETIHNQSTAINEVQDDDIRIFFKNNNLIIEDSSNTQILSEIYSANGTLVNRSFPSKTIDFSNLCRGIYVVKIKSNKRTITKKIIKK